MGYDRREIFFPCRGASCSGILYLPDRPGGPGLVMAMGFGMVKEAHADDYAPFFAEKGFTVLAFDYRRWGRSGGLPRQALYPMDQVDDYRSAIRYLQSEGLADRGRICVWGTSFSGGHVLTLLAFPEEGVQCGIAQVPNVYSYRTALEYFGSLDPVLGLSRDLDRGWRTGEPSYAPIVSREGFGIIASREAVEYYLEMEEKLDSFVNRVTADSIPRILAYNPGDYAGLIRRSLMMVVASRDKTTPPGLAREVAARIPGPVRLLEVEGGHFDIYREPLLSRIAREEAEWASRAVGELAG